MSSGRDEWAMVDKQMSNVDGNSRWRSCADMPIGFRFLFDPAIAWFCIDRMVIGYLIINRQTTSSTRESTRSRIGNAVSPRHLSNSTSSFISHLHLHLCRLELGALSIYALSTYHPSLRS